MNLGGHKKHRIRRHNRHVHIYYNVVYYKCLSYLLTLWKKQTADIFTKMLTDRQTHWHMRQTWKKYALVNWFQGIIKLLIVDQRFSIRKHKATKKLQQMTVQYQPRISSSLSIICWLPTENSSKVISSSYITHLTTATS